MHFVGRHVDGRRTASRAPAHAVVSVVKAEDALGLKREDGRRREADALGAEACSKLSANSSAGVHTFVSRQVDSAYFIHPTDGGRREGGRSAPVHWASNDLQTHHGVVRCTVCVSVSVETVFEPPPTMPRTRRAGAQAQAPTNDDATHGLLAC